MSTKPNRSTETDEEILVNRAKLFLRLVEGIINGADKTLDLAATEADLISPDYTTEIRPTSLSSLSVTARSWEEHKAFFARMGLSDFAFTIERETAGVRRLVLETYSNGVVKDSPEKAQYGQQYILILEFDDQKKVSKLIEFADSLYTAQFFQLDVSPE